MRQHPPDPERVAPEGPAAAADGKAVDAVAEARVAKSATPLTAALVAEARRQFFRVAAVLCIAGSPLPLLLPPGQVDAHWLMAM